MDHKTAQEIALKRYGFIAPLVSGNIDTYKSKSDFFRDAGSKAGVHPHTVRRWYNRYLKFQFIYLILNKPCIFKALRLCNSQTLCIFPCFFPYERKQGKLFVIRRRLPYPAVLRRYASLPL